MSNNEQHNSTDSIRNESETIAANGIKSLINTDEAQSDENNEPQNQIEEKDNDEFIRITAAHQMLIEAQTYDQQNNYTLALQLYRICVDLLLEELMFTEGTKQSHIYLREKCTAIMDRIDQLKLKLEPISSSMTTEQSIPNLSIEQFESLNLS